MNGSRLTLVFDDPEKLNDFLIAKWKSISSEAIRLRGFFTVALSGGQTPAEFYRRLAGEPEAIPWRKTHVFFVDERFVADTDEDSNYRMIRETLLDIADVPLGNIHSIPTDLPDPIKAAERYESDIALFFKLSNGGMPEFDLIMLGIGNDGHTASLFPASPAVNERRRLSCAVTLGGEIHDRITLTLPVINNAGHIIFLVTGKEKARVLRDVVQANSPALPASLVAPARGSLLYLADSEAGALLREKKGERKVKVVPSVLAEDFDDFILKVRQAESFTDYVQIDVMDGVFVDTKSVAPEKISGLNTSLHFEVHLMTQDPASLVREIQNPSLKKVIFHYEADVDHLALLREIGEKRLDAGLAIRPGTTLEECGRIAEHAGTLLFLTVEPGKYGSPFIPEVVRKVAEARRIFPDKTIVVDGGVSLENLEILYKAGVDYVCVGSRIFMGGSPEDNYRRFVKRLDELSRAL